MCEVEVICTIDVYALEKNRNVDGYLWTILQEKKEVICINDPLWKNIVNETMKIACEWQWLCELEVICTIGVYTLKKNINANAYSWTILQGKRDDIRLMIHLWKSWRIKKSKIHCECQCLSEIEETCTINVYGLQKNRDVDAYFWTIHQNKRDIICINNPFLKNKWWMKWLK